MKQLCIDCDAPLPLVADLAAETPLGYEHRCDCGRLYRVSKDTMFFPPGPPLWLPIKETKSYTVPVIINPVGRYCGRCESWGVPNHPDFCCVFKQPLRFYDADKQGCGTQGYRRCEACLTWEREHLAKR